MKNQLTVDKAITRGHLMINIPIFILMFGIPFLSFYLMGINMIPKWAMYVGFVLGFCLAWLAWSMMVTKWRIWAFENVQNVHELKKRAVEEKLIWPDGSFFVKTEIRTSADKERLKRLELKFECPDVHNEDYSLAKKTEVFYSKFNNYYEMILGIVITVVGIYLITFLDKKSVLVGAGLIAVGGYTLFKQLKKNKDKAPQIVIDENGIEAREVKFKDWLHIYDEEVVREGFGKSSKDYLVYRYDVRGYAKIDLEELEISPKKLANALRTYRIRHTNNN